MKDEKSPLTPHGFKDASLDEAQIRHWLDKHPGCAWGCPTSAERAVIDIDPRNGGDASWKALLAEHGNFPDTLKVRTGGGGWHVYCQMPSGTRCRDLADGIELKADGGYVLVPPSKIDIPDHQGRTYAWETKPWEMGIVEAPAWAISQRKEAVRSSARRDAPANPFIVQAESEDLLTHPGGDKTKGERRRPILCRLVGVHAARGDSEASIRRMAEVWASRCVPPLDEWEKHVNGVLNKEATKCDPIKDRLSSEPPGRKESPFVVSLDSDFPGGACAARKESPRIQPEDTFLPGGCAENDPTDPQDTFLPGSAEPEPETDEGVLSSGSDMPTLHHDAYHGLLGEMLRTVEPETEAHPAAILLLWLTCLGNVVGRGAWYPVGARVHHPALFVGIVGLSSDAKGDSWSVASWAFRKVEPEWAQCCVANGIGSGEGLLERVADEQRFVSINKKGIAEETVIPGAADKRCLVRLGELSKAFKLGRRENATLSEHLREAWDGEPIHVPNRKANALGSSGYAISIIGDITPGTLQKTLATGTEAFDGFANRFLWMRVKSPRDVSEPGDMSVLEPFLPRLTDMLAFAKGAGEMKRDDTARAMWNEAYRALKVSGDTVPHTDRARPYVVRLSMLFALVDCSVVIRAEHMRAALAVWNYCRESARLLFNGEASGDPDPLWLDVLNAIDAKPGIHRSKITEQFKHKANAEQLKDVLSLLVKQGMAHPTIENTGGRKAERWWPGKSDHTPDPSGERESDGALPVPARKESKGQEPKFLGEGTSARKVSSGGEPGRSQDTFLPGEDFGQTGDESGRNGSEVVIYNSHASISELPESPDLAEGASAQPLRDDSSVGTSDKEAERHRQWLVRYHAAQAERIATERERTGADDTPLTEDEQAEFFERLKVLDAPTVLKPEKEQPFLECLLAL